MSEGPESSKRPKASSAKACGEVHHYGQTEAQKAYRDRTGQLFIRLEALVPRMASSRSPDPECSRRAAAESRPAPACAVKEDVLKRRTRTEIMEDCVAYIKVMSLVSSVVGFRPSHITS